jgi:hypothetical protein
MGERATAAVSAIAIALFAAAGARAQAPAPQVEIVWTDTPPEIDGRLDDAVWQDAAVITEFTQVIPVPGAAPSQRTEIRLLTDRENLYIAVRCLDTDAEGIVANRMRRDELFFFDDRIQIIVDTFHDRQNGYVFEVNPNGGRRDVLIEGDAFSNSWDTIWYARSRRDAHGWYSELAIPYQSLSYDPDSDTWGLNISRGIRRNNEEMRWADPVPQRFLSDLGNAGLLTGMRGIGSGVGLDVVPSLSLGYENGFIAKTNPAPPPPEVARKIDDFDAKPSGDLFYKLLPSLTATLTANTNFGETEADTRQINFSRFAIAFPEKRDFFLQDALIFEFAELTDDALEIPTNGQSFDSRRIGIAQPDPTTSEFVPGDILFGGKLTGRVGGVKLGALHTLVDELGTVGKQHLTVGRAAVSVLGESTLGMIVTHGDPDGRIDNTVAGADFVYRNNSFRGSKSLTGKAWFQQSFSSGSSNNEFAYAAGIAYPNDRINWKLDFVEIGQNYNPALGFVNRTGIRQYEGAYRYRIRRAGYIRTFDMELRGSLTTDRSNATESSLIAVTPFRYENEFGGRVDLRFQQVFERPLFDFELPGELLVEADSYRWQEAELALRGSRNWRLTGDLTVGGGEYFDGARVYAIPRAEWRPSKHFLLDARYEFRETWLPRARARATLTEHRGTVHVVRSQIAFYFTPNISWSTLVQYDNVSRSVGVNSILRWIVEDGREIFVVLNQGAQAVGGEWKRGVTQPLVKVSWTFRF